MKRLLAVVLVLLCISVSHAASVTLSNSSMVELLGSNFTALGDGVLNTSMENCNLVSEVYSRAFTDGAGTYAYLYQINNNLPESIAFIEMFTVGAFYGADENIEMGYLAGDIPDGFLAGGQTPHLANVNTSVGPTLSYYYLDAFDNSILAGEHSAVMYAVSSYAPDLIVGNVINHETATGLVVGTIPEPATICLLGFGSLLLSRRKGF